MGIRKRPDGLWDIDVSVRVEGKEHRKRCLGFRGSKAKANEKLVELKKDLRQHHGSLKSPHTSRNFLTFGQCLARYRESHNRKWEKYRYEVLEKGLGAVPLHMLADRFAQYIELVRGEKTVMGELPTASTLNKLITITKAALNYCQRLRLIDANPLAKFPKFKENNERDRVISAKEFTALYNCLPDCLRPITLFAYQVPTRRGELEKLRRKDVDVVTGTVLLRAETTKTGKARRVPIPANMVYYFRSIPRECPWAFYKCVRMGSKDIYQQLGCFQSSWRWARHKAGLDDFRFHDLRRVAASNLAKQGVSESLIKTLGGWTTDIFFKRYRHVEMDELQNAVNGRTQAAKPGAESKQKRLRLAV